MKGTLLPLTENDHAQTNQMGRWNGFGTTFLGFSRTDREGCNFATLWLTLLYLPFIPLGRYYVRIGRTEKSYNRNARGTTSKSTTSYTVMGTTGIDGGEILKSYLYRWLICPAIVLVPVYFAWLSLHYLENWGIVVVVLVVVWLVVVPAVLLGLNERRIQNALPRFLDRLLS